MSDESNEWYFPLGTNSLGKGEVDEAWGLVIQRDPHSTWIESLRTQCVPPEASPNAAPEVCRYALDPRHPSVPELVWEAARAVVEAYGQAARVAVLSEEGRVHFFEALAHNLTFVVSRILSEEGLTEADKLGRVREINLLQHEVTAPGWKVRLQWQDWSPWAFTSLLKPYARPEHPSGTLVRWALERSHHQVAQHGGALPR
jgi:hypothetical protein